MTLIMTEIVKTGKPGHEKKVLWQYETLKNSKFATIWRHRWREQRGDDWINIDMAKEIHTFYRNGGEIILNYFMSTHLILFRANAIGQFVKYKWKQ